jgi:hypothetical protein
VFNEVHLELAVEGEAARRLDEAAAGLSLGRYD